jgi:hypothetical protein
LAPGHLFWRAQGRNAASGAGVARSNKKENRMLGRHVYRITPVGNVWRVAKDGEDRPRGEKPSRDAAIAFACALAKQDEPARVTVEDAEGHVAEEQKFGVDQGQAIDAA